MKMVYKKDGRRQKYRRDKLVNSVLQAFNSLYEGEASEAEHEYDLGKARNIADYVESELINKDDNKKVTADMIGELVAKGLMNCKKKDAAVNYILFRDERTRMRGNTTDKTINEIVNGTSDYWTDENSNKNAMMASTQRDYMAGAVSEDISRRQLLPTDVVEAHDAGIIHFHKQYCGAC